jgi:hypothetical protein
MEVGRFATGVERMDAGANPNLIGSSGCSVAAFTSKGAPKSAALFCCLTSGVISTGAIKGSDFWTGAFEVTESVVLGDEGVSATVWANRGGEEGTTGGKNIPFHINRETLQEVSRLCSIQADAQRVKFPTVFETIKG